MINDKFDDGGDVETRFVGRYKYLQQLKDAWPKYRLLSVFGIRAVGKSRLVREFLDHTLIEKTFDGAKPNVSLVKTNDNISNNVSSSDDIVGHSDNIRLVTIDMVLQDTVESLYAHLCAVFYNNPESDATKTNIWIEQIIDSINKISERFVLIFDNAESVVEGSMREPVLTLVQQIVSCCVHSKIMFTSTTSFMLPQIKSEIFTLELLPFTLTDSKHLLQSVAPSVTLGKYERSILEMSEGLPLLILMIGAELEEDDGITPEDMAEMLASFRLRALSRVYYPEEDRIADVYRKFIKRLSKKSQHRMSILNFIPGSFNIVEARGILGHKTDDWTYNHAIFQLRRRHMVIHQSSTKRFVIQGILKECLHVCFTLKHIPEVRARYIKTFANVMQDIANKLGTVEYTKALSEFAAEQPNLQKLLTEVMYTREDTYPFFIQVAEKCTTLIERFFMRESESFYDGCLQLANQYGKEVDKATVHIAVGSMATNVKGDLEKGALYYDSASKILVQRGRSLQLATVYQRMGWNLHMQGNNVDALRYFKKSLDISLTSGKEYQLLMLQSFNSLGVTHTVLGNLDEAEKYHFQALERSKRILGEDNPSVGTTYNNVGVFYFAKGDHEKALEFYEKGLEIKRNKQFPANSIVYSLSNIAETYSGMGHYKEAHGYCQQAMDVIKEPAIPHVHAIALIYDTHEGNFKQACKMFTKSIEITETNRMDGITYIESKLHLAQAKTKEGKHDIAVKMAKDVLDKKDNIITTMPRHTFIQECLECLADIYKEAGDNVKYSDTLDKIQFELFRLEQFHLCQCNEKAVAKIQIQLNEVNAKIKQLTDD